jgi:lipopolysaccharide export system protein LptA
MRSHFFNPSLQKFIYICLCFVSINSTYVFAEKADRDKPIELESDTMTSDDSKNTSVYTGNFILTQGTLLIKADELTVREACDLIMKAQGTYDAIIAPYFK